MIVIGLPKTTKEKVTKVEGLIKKVLKKTNHVAEKIEIQVKNENTTGIAVLEFQNIEKAKKAALSFDGLKVAKLQFEALTFSDYSYFLELVKMN